MTAQGWEFVPEEPDFYGRTMGEALARQARLRWPRNTAKTVAREWGIDPSTADNLLRGHASERTITKAIKAEGWPLLAALGAALTGQTYDQHIQFMIEETDRARAKLERRRDQVRALEARAYQAGLVDRQPAE